MRFAGEEHAPPISLDRLCLSAGVDEPACQLLVRPRQRRLFAERPESVQPAQLGEMFVPGLGPHRVVGEVVPVQVELAADGIPRPPTERTRPEPAGGPGSGARTAAVRSPACCGVAAAPRCAAGLRRSGCSGAAGPLRAAEVKTGPTVVGWSERFSAPSLEANLYHDLASGVRDDRPGLGNCLRALRRTTCSVVWKLDSPRPQPRPSGQHRARPIRPRRGSAGTRRPGRADRRHRRRRPAASSTSAEHVFDLSPSLTAALLSCFGISSLRRQECSSGTTNARKPGTRSVRWSSCGRLPVAGRCRARRRWPAVRVRLAWRCARAGCARRGAGKWR